jgi:hypothetical protein
MCISISFQKLQRILAWDRPCRLELLQQAHGLHNSRDRTGKNAQRWAALKMIRGGSEDHGQQGVSSFQNHSSASQITRNGGSGSGVPEQPQISTEAAHESETAHAASATLKTPPHETSALAALQNLLQWKICYRTFCNGKSLR